MLCFALIKNDERVDMHMVVYFPSNVDEISCFIFALNALCFATSLGPVTPSLVECQLVFRFILHVVN